jgi:VWFA-related protein
MDASNSPTAENQMRLLRSAVLVLVALGFGAGTIAKIRGASLNVRTGAQQQRPSPPGTIQVQVRLIPVDVVVTDSHDRPVTDLKQEDFQVFDNGVQQVIRHFAVQKLTPGAQESEQTSQLRASPTLDLTPQSARTFLIMMGRGRLQRPFKSVDALIRFVRNGLLPQDRVAIFAYNRATSFTTDHEKIARVLEQYKAVHEDIEAKLASLQGGLAAVYGSKSIPASMQPEIDRVFAERKRAGIPAAGQKADNHNPGDALRTEDASVSNPFDALATDANADLPFEEYAATFASTYQDIQNIFTCLKYLRYMEGEKHLLFFTENGLFVPRGDDDSGIAAVANDARVVIDTFQTGGVPPGIWARWNEFFAVSSLRDISHLTGGRAAVYRDIGDALKTVDETSRVQYLLGYYPSDESWNGAYRRINVKVSRPGNLKVSFRRGYYARDTVTAFNREEFLAYSRISAAAAYGPVLSDILFKVSTSSIKDSAGAPQLRVDLQINPGLIIFKTANGMHTCRLRTAVFYADANGKYLGDVWNWLELNQPEEMYQQTMRSWIPFSMLIALKGPRQILKTIIYDTGSDKVGSKVTVAR